MNIDAKIAKYLFGADVVGEGSWDVDAVSQHVKKHGQGHYKGFLQVDVCVPWYHHAGGLCADDLIHGHHPLCLRPVYPYSTSHAYTGDIIGALINLDFVVIMHCDIAYGKPHYMCTISKYKMSYNAHDAEEESFPLALCKAALKALGVKDEG